MYTCDNHHWSYYLYMLTSKKVCQQMAHFSTLKALHYTKHIFHGGYFIYMNRS